MANNQQKMNFIKEFIKKNGTTIRGQSLAEIMGYSSLSAFNRAYFNGRIEIHLYPMPVGKGRFAKTKDVAEYLWRKKMTN